MTKDKDCRMTTADTGVSSKEDFRNRKAAKFDEVAKSPGGGREIMSCRAAPPVADTCLDIESNSQRGIKAEKKPQSDTRGSTMSTTNYLKLFKFKSLSLGRCKKNKSCDSVEETSSTLAPPRATAAAVVLPKAEPGVATSTFYGYFFIKAFPGLKNDFTKMFIVLMLRQGILAGLSIQTPRGFLHAP